jgi:hypothetical protein
VNSTIADNEAQDHGGGIYVFGGALDITNSSILDNGTPSATLGAGGNLYLNNATSLNVDTTTIDGGYGRYGAGIYYTRSGGVGTATIRNSTISSNAASQGGGGLALAFAGNVDFQILNSTISSNDAAQRGGGIYYTSGGTGAGLKLNNVTVAYNEVTGNTLGGGIRTEANRSKINLHNTIVAENLALGSANDISGLVSTTSSYNLVGPTGTGGLSDGVLGNIVLDSGESAGLAALEDNGGPTKTHALLISSWAIDSGNNSLASAFTSISVARIIPEFAMVASG